MPKKWFALRVQSNKEDVVKSNIERKIEKATDLKEKVSRILVPSESVSEIKGGSRRIRENKLYPGYIFVEIEVDEDDKIPDSIWFLIKETHGTGDFLGSASKPVPMDVAEVEKLLGEASRKEEQPKLKIEFKVGDSVKIKEGPFENFDGIVEEVFPEKGTVRVVVTIFGRATPVELEYWQVESI